MNRVCGVAVIAAWLAGWPGPAAAQSNGHAVELGGHVAVVRSGQFDAADVGLGGRVSWHPVRFIGVESEIAFYPGDFPGGQPFSGSRLEALFGATLGPAFDRLRVFGRARAGFVRWGRAPRPIACILIYPPPLSCELSQGQTVPAFDVGGGIEVFASSRVFARIDVGDRLVRYRGPVYDSGGTLRHEAFLGHDFRLAAGGGVRF
jgi:hypothetical protein